MKSALLIALTLVGCVSANNLDYQMNTWIGFDSNALMLNWGAPKSETKLSDGSKTFAYNQGECDITFGVDASNKVKSATWRGSKYKCKKQIRMAPKSGG